MPGGPAARRAGGVERGLARASWEHSHRAAVDAFKQRREADLALVREAILGPAPAARDRPIEPNASAAIEERPALAADEIAAEDESFRGAASIAAAHESAHMVGYFDGGLLLGAVTLQRGPTGGCGGYARCFVDRDSRQQRLTLFRAGLLGPIFDVMFEDRMVDGGPSRPSLHTALLESSRDGDLADAREVLPSLSGANRRKRITREIRLGVEFLYRPRTRFLMYRLARKLRVEGEVSGLMAFTVLNCAAAEWAAGIRV
jgi:hypothetical protein